MQFCHECISTYGQTFYTYPMIMDYLLKMSRNFISGKYNLVIVK